MALVVFLRGVNVGRHKRFQPGILAKELAHLDVINVGAAGTFVVRKPVGMTALRDEILERLPFEAEVMICSGRDLLELTRRKFFPEERSHPDAQRFVSVLAKRPAKIPRLPITQPAGEAWQVKLVEVSGPFALTLWRRVGKRLLYPNEVVEKTLGVPVTTRNWNTITTVCGMLEAVSPRGR